MSLPVAQHDQEPIRRRALAEGLVRHSQHPGVIRPRLGQVGRVQPGEDIPHDFVVGAHWNLQKRRSRENRQPDALPLQLIQQGTDQKFRPGQPGRFDILGQHAGGEIQGDKHFPGLVEHHFFQIPPLGSRQRHEHQRAA